MIFAFGPHGRTGPFWKWFWNGLFNRLSILYTLTYFLIVWNVFYMYVFFKTCMYIWISEIKTNKQYKTWILSLQHLRNATILDGKILMGKFVNGASSSVTKHSSTVFISISK